MKVWPILGVALGVSGRIKVCHLQSRICTMKFAYSTAQNLVLMIFYKAGATQLKN
jgi:hypothetical protein